MKREINPEKVQGKNAYKDAPIQGTCAYIQYEQKII